MKDKFRLNNKVAVVLGGTGGIGKACAFDLGQQGAKVVVASRNMEKLQEVAEKIESETNSEAAAFQVDVTNEGNVKRLA